METLLRSPVILTGEALIKLCELGYRDLIGASAAQANSALVLRGLIPTKPTYTPSIEPPGTVIAQRPLAGTLVPAGERATLTLSAGGLSAPEEELQMEMGEE